MKTSEITSFESRIDNLIGIAKAESDVETKSHLSRYICVLVSGYIEVSLRSILFEYCKSRSSKEVSSYVDNRLRRFQNPNFERVSQLVGVFDEVKRRKLEGLDEETKEAINSIINNRNGIAHGQNIGISLVTISSYYKQAKKLVQFVSNEF